MFDSLRRSFQILDRREKRTYLALVFSRIFLQVLDLVGLLLIGTMLSAAASRLAEPSEVAQTAISLTINSELDFLVLAATTAGLFIVKSTLGSVLLRTTTKFLARLEGSLAEEISFYFTSGDLERLKSASVPEQQWLVGHGSNVAISLVLLAGSTVVTEAALFLVVFWAFFLIDAPTAAAVGAFFGLVAIIFQLVVNRRLKRLGRRLAESSIEVSDLTLSFVEGYREIASLGRFGELRKVFRATRGQYAHDLGTQKFVMGFPRYLVEVALMVGVFGLISWQFILGSLEQSVVVLGVFVAGGLRMMAALLPMQNAISDLRTRGAEANRVHDLLDKIRRPTFASGQDAPREASFKSAEACHVNIRKVSFTFLGAGSVGITELDLEVPPGSFAAIIGPSGAGKSTLLDLMLGFLTPTSGTVDIDGVSSNHFIVHNPGAVAYVPQRTVIIGGTIAENIAVGIPRHEIDMLRVNQLVDQLGLRELVSGHAEGLNTLVSRTRNPLSGGQSQKLALARALYSKPKLLLIDEATSAMDPESERAISEVILSLRGTTTIVAVAHRLATVKSADRVFVIENGQLLGAGTFSEVRGTVPFVENYIQLTNIE